MITQEGGPRRNATSTMQSRGQKVWSAIKSNISDHSMDEDKYQEGLKQRKAMKYLKESYYHCIEYFTANSLIVLMRK